MSLQEVTKVAAMGRTLNMHKTLWFWLVRKSPRLRLVSDGTQVPSQTQVSFLSVCSDSHSSCSFSLSSLSS